MTTISILLLLAFVASVFSLVRWVKHDSIGYQTPLRSDHFDEFQTVRRQSNRR